MQYSDKMTHCTLLMRLKNPADETAWTEFAQFYWDIITGWARNKGCPPSLLDDVFQETMLCLLRIMPEFEYHPEKGRFRGLLKKIVYARVIDTIRSRKNENELFASPDGESDEKDAVENNILLAVSDNSENDEIWIRGVVSQALRQAYGKVDSLTYKSFCLYVLEGLDVNEVCKRLGIDRPGTVYQHKSRFLGIVQKEFMQIIQDIGDEETLAMMTKNEKVILSALESLVDSTPNYRETIVQDTMNRALSRRIDDIRIKMSSVSIPEQTGLFLLVIPEKGNPFHVSVGKTLRAGRDRSSDVILNSETVSGHHATFELKGTTVSVKDESSANGTYVNGSRIERRILVSGDLVQLGGCSVIYYDKSQVQSIKGDMTIHFGYIGLIEDGKAPSS